MKKESLWMDTVHLPEQLKLQQDLRTEVCIVGAGIAGLSTAYLLTQAGKKVAVLDDGPLVSGMTAVTTAHLAVELDHRYQELERYHGQQGIRLIAQSHAAAIDRIEANSKKEAIDCDFQRLNGYLFLAPEDKEETLDKELEAAINAGVKNVEKLPCTPLDALESVPCLRFPNQAQFHPLKYLRGLAQAIVRDGGKLFTHSHVDRIEGGKPSRAVAGPYTVTADALVVTTNSPINDLLVLHTKQAPYMTYVIGGRVPHGTLQRALWWDTADPYHYVRLHPVHQANQNYDLLIVGGEDHKSGQVQEEAGLRHGRLETWARERFPMMQELEYAWAGQVLESIDGIAYIGRNPLDADNIYVATGFSGIGMTHGTIAGMLISDLILGRENPWETLYDPTRKSLRAGGEFAKETLNMASQYTDWLTGGDVASVEEIPCEAGAILRKGLSKMAIYRDARGQLHEFSAVCPHLGCIVQWNDTEKTWDCPCHGSRFKKEGQVFNGPANRNLSPIQTT
jgi:glycine/D-amino acid oxidase-like deaminating enzyme/nitrite reductase/ring-hydroxylating ferredoxin subunit